ncbi:MAG TPA: hypothetical protein VNH46_05975 [Gemmatimonadales bacterium]|nr:hypothetical protein [Gemmatimonadales bacterium]
MELSPTGEPAHPGHVGLALRAMAFGVLAGTAFVSLALFAVRTLQQSGAPRSTQFTILAGGTLGGPALAIGSAWYLMRPLTSAYRRGGFAMVAGFATFVSMLPTRIAEQLFGRFGLLGYAALCVVGAVLAARAAVRRATAE